MANSYTKAAFGFTVTAAEADMLRRVIHAVDLIGDIDQDLDALEAQYALLGPDFVALFPRTELSPFDGLLDLIPDINHPVLDFDIDVGTADEAGQVPVFLSGEQFGVEAAAALIQRCARSALPFGFEWATDCDRLRAGEFGGGYVVITEAAIAYGHTSQLLDRALARVGDQGADGFVLAIRHPAHGLSFWSDDDGFGRLAQARVFTEAEAAGFDVPLAIDPPEWLAMPAPRPL